MASGFHFLLVLCLAGGLWMEADAKCPKVHDHTDAHRGDSKTGHCCETCPSGWTKLGSRCYVFNFQEKEWADAELSCVALGGNLASLVEAGDYKLLRDMVKQAAGSDKVTWLGGHDAAKEGAWLWSDGSKFDFKGWHQGEPNNLGGEHCMEMNFREKDFVNDQKCQEKRSYICVRAPSDEQK